MKLSDYIFGAVADAGVRHVFYLPGGGAMHLVDSLGRSNRLEPVLMLHEQAAAIAAEAYARVTGNLGVVLVTTGPGGTNALTGVAGAWIESTPCWWSRARSSARISWEIAVFASSARRRWTSSG